jgi:hypothetical protein
MLEASLVHSAFSVYVVILITSNLLGLLTQKKVNTTHLAVHSFVGLVMVRLIRTNTGSHANESSGRILAFVVGAACIACFVLGISVGKAFSTDSGGHKSGENSMLRSGSSKDALSAANGADTSKTEILERKIKLKPKGDAAHKETPDAEHPRASTATPNSTAVVNNAAVTVKPEEQLGDTMKQGINYRPPFADDTYKAIMEKSKATVMSIVGLLSYPGCTDTYTQCQWTVIRSATSANLWVSKSKNDGILLRATSLVNTPAKSVMKWILHNDLAVGVESLCFRKETLKTFKGENNTRLRRLSCKSGSLTSSKRDFVVISGVSTLGDGTILMTSRSLQVPPTITPAMRKPNKHGFIRGILHGSGFILRPIRCMDSGGYDMCEVFLAVHVDMLGSASGRVNESKREILADVVLQIMDLLKGGAANYFSSNSTAEDANARSTSGDGHDFFDEGDETSLRESMDIGSDGSGDHNKPTRASSGGGVVGVPTPVASSTGAGHVVKTKEDEEIEKNARALGLDPVQVSEILSTSENAVKHLKELYASKCVQLGSPTNSSSTSSVARSLTPPATGPATPGKLVTLPDASGTSPNPNASTAKITWETFYDQDGISVSEHLGSNRPVGTLSATCALEASPQTIKTLLVEHQDQIDGMLAGKSVLHKIDRNAYVQWLAYRSIWPLGARDFLLVTAERSMPSVDSSASGEGFLIVSTSIDDICEEIDETEFDESNDGTGASALLGANNKTSKFADFSRSKIRLAGYIGMPSTTIRGGTDLSLFVDIDVYSYTPAWLVQVLAQYGLSEMMGRIRRATMGQNLIDHSGQSQLNAVLARIQTWESRLKLFRDGEDPHRSPPLQSPAPSGNKKHFDNGVLSPNSVSQTESSSMATNVAALQAALNTAAQSDSHHTAGNARPPTSPVTPLTANDSASSGSETSSAASSRVTSPQPIAESALAPIAEDTEPEEPAAPQVAAEPAPVPVPVPPPVQRSPGQILSDQAVVMYQKYVGLLPSGDLELDWQQKVNKGTITVDASKVAGSTWQAIRGKMLMQAQKEKILDLLLNDDRIGEFDDMFDFYKV